jgi:hypothetical protein
MDRFTDSEKARLGKQRNVSIFRLQRGCAKSCWGRPMQSWPILQLNTDENSHHAVVATTLECSHETDGDKHCHDMLPHRAEALASRAAREERGRGDLEHHRGRGHHLGLHRRRRSPIAGQTLDFRSRM